LQIVDTKINSAPENDEIFVRTRQTVIALPVQAIRNASWDQLKSLLNGKREMRVMQHLSRIVGYFSLMHNWNRSKLTELADRHIGQYGVSEVQKKTKASGKTNHTIHQIDLADNELAPVCENGLCHLSL
jgi:hypothetical protein